MLKMNETFDPENYEKMIRICGSGYQYCDGNCSVCSINNTTTSNKTETTDTYVNVATSTDKPSKAQYEQSLRTKSLLSDWMRTCRKQQDELIDELCKARETEKFYLASYEQHRNIVRRYEIYEDIENG